VHIGQLAKHDQRDILTKYLLSPTGEITWQYERIHMRSIYHDMLYE